MRNAVIVVVMLFATVPAFGDQSSKPDPKATARFGALRSEQQKHSYGRLFKAQEEPKKVLALAQAQALMPKMKVVCGMTIIEGDPTIDPKIAISPVKPDNFEFKIRAFEPPVCKSAY